MPEVVGTFGDAALIARILMFETVFAAVTVPLAIAFVS